ncbi:MAG: SLAC1 anion channel family protein [Sulfurospirillum sp.]
MILRKRSLSCFPVQFFAVLMGISGLTIVYAKAYHILNFSSFWYLSLLSINTILFFIIFTIYLRKWIQYPQKVEEEMHHPIKSSFVPAISISFLLLSIAYYDYAPTVSVSLWFIGAPLHLYFTLRTIKFWMMHEKLNINHINPAWFIPVVGNLLVPVVGIDVLPISVSIFYFSVGFFFWIMLFVIVMYRMIFHNPMASKLVPTLFILIAPPAVGFISYFRITFGSIDMMSMFLYSIAFVILFLMFAKLKVFMSAKFFISWWAYTFPLAAISIASILMYMTYPNSFNYTVAILLIGFTTTIVALVFYKTIIGIKEEQLCIEED